MTSPSRFIIALAAPTLAAGTTAEEFAAHIKRELARWAKVIAQARIRPEGRAAVAAATVLLLALRPMPVAAHTSPGAMGHSELIPRDLERTVEDAKNIDVSVVLHEVGDSVMPVEQYANVSRRDLVSGGPSPET